LLLLPVSVAYAGQTVEVEPGGTYPVKASVDNLTSIGMADGLRLQAVFGVETAVSISKDEAFGRAIIKPVGDEVFSLIVTDENGDSYALEVSPVAGPGEVITLKRKSHRASEALIRAEREMPYTKRLKQAFKAVAQGEVPAGYRVEPRTQTVPLWIEAELQLLRVYQGDMTIEHYRLRNVSGAEMRLDEREFRALGSVVSVAIREHLLAPAGTTDVFVVRRISDTEGALRERT
jgi:type-F conjugative transfer system secretin TraK